MNPKFLRILEFPKILDRLADHTSFSASRDLALSLEPSTDFSEVARRQAETTEAKDLLDRQGGVSIGGAHDVRPLVRNAEIDAMLQPHDLLDIRDTLDSGRRMRKLITGSEVRRPTLGTVAKRIEPCTGLRQAIEGAISDGGEVRDDASPKLNRIRRDLTITRERLTSKLQDIVSSSSMSRYLQEPIITQRGGRFVVPVKSQHKGQVQGIVHDVSASGATVFMEPTSTVELGNQIRELEVAEKEEIERILRSLSAQVAAKSDAIRRTVEALAQIDLALAKARYSQSLHGAEPQLLRLMKEEAAKDVPSHRIAAAPYLKLMKARHPLLPPETVIPIDVHVGNDFRILVVTGPNTGGKTVTLKTVGLLIAMAQSGMQLPASEGSMLTIFDGVFADIGDEQSIEQSLSTFSSHLSNITEMLEEADDRSLVLLDELGAGTDPVEGSALARALLSHLLERQVTTLVATHFSELKLYAHSTEGVQNASVEFDMETLSPTYELTIGLPGRSNAFAIAERLGLDPAVVNRARQMLSSSELEVESLLEGIKETRRDASKEREAAERARREAEQIERELKERLARIDEERREILNQARVQAQRELEEVRNELDRVQSRIDRAMAEEEELTAAADKVEELMEEIRPETAPPEPPAPGIDELQVGDRVWVRALEKEGEITAMIDGDVEVQVGGFRAKVSLTQLEPRAKKPAPEEGRSGVRLHRADTPEPGLELDLRGCTVDEALPRLEKYLDDAYLSHLPKVEIVHGKGTGALRKAVREELTDHPLVESFRPGERHEGGDGATVVTIKSR